MPTRISDPVRATAFIRDKASALGFDTVRLTSATLPPEIGAHLRAFLDADHHGGMTWLAETHERRESPTALWPEARTAIVLGMNYAPDTDPLALLSRPERGAISVYAQNRDYHDLIKGRLKQLAGQMAATLGGEVKVFVDTAPLMEKPLAQAAGLGWQGKHTCLVSREFGSWLFLGVILTTLDLPHDTAEDDHCGTCRKCIDICPTQAIVGERQIDARRCISYLTIEHKGPIPVAFRAAMGNRIYGCDDCLAVCPWNKYAQDAREQAFHPRDDLRAPLLAELATLGDAAFRAHFSGSPIKRIGRDRFIRNVLIALGNTADTHNVSHIEPHLEDTSPLVRGAAVWALKRLISHDAWVAIREKCLTYEQDPDVCMEWEAENEGSHRI